MTTKILNMIVCAVVVVSALAMFIAGSVADLEAAHALYVGQNSYMNVLGEVLGEVPAYLTLAVACMLLFIGAKRRGFGEHKINIVFMTVYMLGAVAAFMMLFLPAAEYILQGALGYVLALLIGVFMTCGMLFMFKNIDDVRIESLKKWCATTIVGILSVIAVVYILKFVWGRTRYYDLVDAGDGFSAFTNWWQPRGVTGDRSFPSGHTALACCSLFLIPLAGIISDKKSRWQLCTAVTVVVFTVLIAFFRMMGGNHFLTDVSLGMIVAVVSYAVTSFVSYGKQLDGYKMKENSFLGKL